MIGPLEKGMQLAAVGAPVEGVYEGVDLRVLPKYIAFKAALLRTKLTQQYVIVVLAALLGAHVVFTRVEVYSLYGKLREKEYILAPGVQDFTPASPQTVPDSYIADAVSDFLNRLGNIGPTTIEEQYEFLSRFMSPQLKVRFAAESAGFKAKVKAEGISETLTVTSREVQMSGQGFYRVAALARRETYVNNEYLGHTDEAIEMELELVPPKRDRAWYVQINALTRQTADGFRVKKSF